MSEHRLSEIVIERPRWGRRINLKKTTGSKKHLNRLTEEASEDGLLQPYLIKPRNKTKGLSDHLGPLRRFLRSNVGQPWDRVYSELCQRLDSSTMAGQHVLGHVWDYVERHVELIDGIPYHKSSRLTGYPLGPTYREDRFYVHPETGLLCVCEKQPRQEKQTQSKNVVILDDHRQYHQINGIWYLITFEEFPLSPTRWVTDVLHGLISYDRATSIKGRSMYAANKQQCNKRTIQLIKSQNKG